jgi:hypothetical protein
VVLVTLEAVIRPKWVSEEQVLYPTHQLQAWILPANIDLFRRPNFFMGSESLAMDI